MARKRMSALERYCKDVISGKEIACEKIKLICQKLLNDIKNPGTYHFDQKLAERPVEFIERFCYMPSGKLGKPFILEPYEKAWVEALFGFVDEDDNRQYQEALIVVARKNGKSSLAAAIELYLLLADGEGAPQIYNVANSGEQAKLSFNAAMRMRSQSKKLSSKIRKRASDLFNPSNLGYIMPLTSNSRAMDGLDVHGGVLDEMAAMKDRDLYDLVKQGMSAREQPILLCITTNGFVRNGVFDAQYEYASKVISGEIKDDRFLPFIYELDNREEWKDEKCWKKANPGLGTVKKIDTLRGYVQKAKDDPSFRPTVMTKDFNLPENNAIAWLTFDEAVNEEVVDMNEMKFRYCIVGFDASDTIDLTCAQALMMKPGDDHIYEKSMYWIPEETVLQDSESGSRKERDGVPYQAWISRGLLRTVPGNKIDKKVLLDWLNELKDEHDIYTFAIGFDPWHMDDSTRRDLEDFVGKGNATPVRQGAITLSQPMKQIRADYKANRLIDNHNPINEWCRMNVSIKTDVNGNIQPVKKLNDPRNRIDGFAAEIFAYTTLCNRMEDYQNVI